MSASKEKKNRQAQAADGTSDPRTVREARQRKEEKRSNVLYGIIAVVFVLVAAVTLTWKSGIVQRKATAATVNGKSYSAAQVEYYFRSVYQNFINNNSNYLSYMGLDTSKSLKEQDCLMTDDGSWYDYFMDTALDQMSAVYALCDAAEKDDYAWNDDMQADYDTAMSNLESGRQQYETTYGTTVTANAYLKLLYGSVMTKKVYESELKSSILSQSYSDHYTASLTYTDSDLEEAYKSDTKTYDAVSYEDIVVNGAAESTTDKDGKTVAATDEEKTAAMAEAKTLADSLYASYQSGKGLSELADTDKRATYASSTSGTYSDSILMNWLYDDARKEGDSAVLEDKDGSSYYVVVFGSRFREEYNTVDVRHILFQPSTGSKQEGDDGYDAEQAILKAAAKKEAEAVLDEWKAGEATEESFAELATKNSSDTSSASNGGLYERIHKGQVVEAFENWSFDPARKPGDTGIVQTDYGFHVMYFVKVDVPYWKAKVESNLKNADYKEWYAATTKGYEAKMHKFGAQFVV